jgi:hypothetical protein
MRRPSDLGPLLVIALGASLGLVLRSGVRPIDHELRLGRVRAAVEEAERGLPPVSPLACTVPFHLEAAPSDWAVVGSYDGTARLTPKGLAVEIHRGYSLSAEADVTLRGLVLGVAQATEEGWFVSHPAEPIALGPLARGVPRPLRPARVFIPGVGADDLVNGWLVLEHVIEAPDVEGGTAWTYLHAPRGDLRPLLQVGCQP